MPVTLAENLVISETLNLLGELERLQIPVTEVVVNRLYPENACPRVRRRHGGGSRQLLNELFSRSSLGGYPWWGVRPVPGGNARSRLLDKFWEGAAELSG